MKAQAACGGCLGAVQDGCFPCLSEILPSDELDARGGIRDCGVACWKSCGVIPFFLFVLALDSLPGAAG